MKEIYTDSFFDVGSEYGFLPNNHPLESLPIRYKNLQHLLDNMPVKLSDGSSGYLAFPNNPGYVSSKGGVRSLTKALALDYSNFKIRVNSISPGYINDGMSKYIYMYKKKNKKRLQRMILKRWGTPEDLFGIVEYLFSSKSSYVTGQDFVIDGGWISKGL